MTEAGVRRYGFHGLSYAYIASVLPRYDPGLAAGRVVVAHLGNGASLCALNNGASIATTMGFSALDGLPMGTRCGTIDAGVVFYMLREMKLSPEEAERFLYTKCGLLGVSGISNDMRKLRSLAATDPKAREAIDLFIYRIGREMGSLVAALGASTLSSSRAASARMTQRHARKSCVAPHGPDLRSTRPRMRTAGPGSTRGTGPSAWVIPTDEELMIARAVRDLLGKTQRQLAS